MQQVRLEAHNTPCPEGNSIPFLNFESLILGRISAWCHSLTTGALSLSFSCRLLDHPPLCVSWCHHALPCPTRSRLHSFCPTRLPYEIEIAQFYVETNDQKYALRDWDWDWTVQFYVETNDQNTPYTLSGGLNNFRSCVNETQHDITYISDRNVFIRALWCFKFLLRMSRP